MNKESYNFLGHVYCCQIGEFVKIGMSVDPGRRIRNLLSPTGLRFDDVKKHWSEPHTNYRTNEALLHNMFKAHRKKGTELFRISFKTAVRAMDKLKIEDNNSRMQEEAEWLVSGLLGPLFNRTSSSVDYTSKRKSYYEFTRLSFTYVKAMKIGDVAPPEDKPTKTFEEIISLIDIGAFLCECRCRVQETREHVVQLAFLLAKSFYFFDDYLTSQLGAFLSEKANYQVPSDWSEGLKD